MNIMELVDSIIDQFAADVLKGEDWIASWDVYRQFIGHFPKFSNPIFNRETLESYLIDYLKTWTKVEVRD